MRTEAEIRQKLRKTIIDLEVATEKGNQVLITGLTYQVQLLDWILASGLSQVVRKPRRKRVT